jgi:hypothetical protein
MARSWFKGIGEREGEGMAEALFVKVEQACPCDPQMVPPFFAWIYSRPFQIATVDQVTDGTSGDGEDRGDIADFDERRNGLFLVFIYLTHIPSRAILLS